MENRSLDNIIKSSLEDFEVEYTTKDWAFMEDMLNAEEVTPVDETAKSKLHNLEVPLDATAWLAMESVLDSLEVDGIDDVAQSALEDFEVPYNPDDWLSMEQKIDAEIPDSIDELAKTALNDFEVPFLPIHWAIMDNQLDDAGFPHEIDEAAKAALHKYESTQPSDWAALESSLMEEENVRRQLILTKSIELVLFVFAIWTIGNFLPFSHKSSAVSTTPSKETVQQKNTTAAPQANNNTDSKVDESTLLNFSSLTESGNDLSVEYKANVPTNLSIDNHSTTEPKNSSVIFKIENSALPFIQKIEADESNMTKEKASTAQPLATLSADEFLKSEKDNFKLSLSDNLEVIAANSFDSNINLNDAQVVSDELVTYGKDKKGPVLTLKADKSQSTNTLIVASFVETKTPKLVIGIPEDLESEINSTYITPPFHIKSSISTQRAAFIEEDKNHSAVGYATNLGIDYAISDKLEFSTGFAYNSKSYSYRALTPFVNANHPQVVDISRNVKLDILQIPLRLNWNIKKNKKTRLYTLAGITPGLIMKEDTRNLHSSLINDVTAATYRNILEDDGDNNFASTVEVKSTNDKISARTFLTADVGIGLEYKTNTRFSFFIEPLFQRSIGGVGDNDEKYKNYSLALGSRVTL